MNKQNTHIEDLIVTHLSGNLDEVSLQELQDWISASAKNRDYFVHQQEIWFAAICAKEESAYNEEEAFVKFQNKVKNAESPKRKTIRLNKILSRAAMIVSFLAISYVSYWQGGKRVKNQLGNVMTVEAPLGAKAKLFLPDGTLVWLNAGSKLSYSQDFGMVSRNVELMGEAYFEVTKNKEIPFNVKSKELNVQVLGTKFNFRNYADDSEVMVALLEGKVSFANQLKKAPIRYLAPDEKVVLDKKSGIAVISSIKASNTSVWTSGYLFFDEELLLNITKNLERNYKVKIDITNESLKNYRFYGNFIQREQTIREVLDILAGTGKIHYAFKDNSHITIY